MESKKKNKQNKNKLIDTETKGTPARGEGEGLGEMVKGSILNNTVVSLHDDG